MTAYNPPAHADTQLDEALVAAAVQGDDALTADLLKRARKTRRQAAERPELPQQRDAV